MTKKLMTRVIREKIQQNIAYFEQYNVCPENEYCFNVYNNHDPNCSITKTLIEDIESQGYTFLHVQLKDGVIVARFTYRKV